MEPAQCASFEFGFKSPSGPRSAPGRRLRTSPRLAPGRPGSKNFEERASQRVFPIVVRGVFEHVYPFTCMQPDGGAYVLGANSLAERAQFHYADGLSRSIVDWPSALLWLRRRVCRGRPRHAPFRARVLTVKSSAARRTVGRKEKRPSGREKSRRVDEVFLASLRPAFDAPRRTGEVDLWRD